ncbi:hypothetical protein STEG23_005700, partial [Scotinomys teguina]
MKAESGDAAGHCHEKQDVKERSSAKLPALTVAASSKFPEASESTLERLNLRSGYWLLSKGIRWTQRTKECSNQSFSHSPNGPLGRLKHSTVLIWGNALQFSLDPLRRYVETMMETLFIGENKIRENCFSVIT